MSKTVRQAYAATIVLGKGKTVAPGVPIALPEEEAKKLADAFGTVEPVAQAVPERRTKVSSEAAKLEESVREKAEALARAAEAAEKEPSDENIAAMEAAQADLAAAEDAVKAAS